MSDETPGIEGMGGEESTGGETPSTEGAGAGGELAPTGVEPIQLEWRRLHPLSPLLRGGLFLLVVVGIVVANLRDRIFELFLDERIVDAMGPNEGDLVDYLAEQRLLVWGLAAVAGIILLVVGFSWLSWRFSTFRITADAVESQHGVLFRQHRRAPLERIQSVNLQRSLLARLLGLTQVDVQTAGQGGKVALQYLGHREAKEVREQILLAARASKMAGLLPSDSAVLSAPAAEGVPAGLAVDPMGRAYSAAPGAFDSRIRDIADFDIDPNAREAGALIRVPVGRLIASLLLSSEMLSVVIIVIAIAVVSIWATPFALAGLFPVGLVMVSMLISQFNKGFNFVLSRAADGVRIGAGLTATSTETIPSGRVHAVEARQPIGWRPFGWWKIRITTAGHSAAEGGQNKMQNTVLPVGSIDDVSRVFETLLHTDAGRSEERRGSLKAALVGAGEGYVAAGPTSGLLLWFGKRRAGLRIEDATESYASLRVRRGWLTRSLAVMPIVRAQSVQFSRPPVHHLLGLASIQAHTVLGPVRVHMRGIELVQARQVFDELAQTVVRVQGSDAAVRAAAVASAAAVDAAAVGVAEQRVVAADSATVEATGPAEPSMPIEPSVAIEPGVPAEPSASDHSTHTESPE